MAMAQGGRKEHCSPQHITQLTTVLGTSHRPRSVGGSNRELDLNQSNLRWNEPGSFRCSPYTGWADLFAASAPSLTDLRGEGEVPARHGGPRGLGGRVAEGRVRGGRAGVVRLGLPAMPEQPLNGRPHPLAVRQLRDLQLVCRAWGGEGGGRGIPQAGSLQKRDPVSSGFRDKARGGLAWPL